MNRIISSYVVNVLFIGLASWAFIELYYFEVEFANIIQTEKVPFEISMSITPFLLLLIVAVVSTIFYKVQKKKYKKLSFWMFPLLFPQDDEREEIITAKACRTTFMALWYVMPTAAALLVIYPIVTPYIPAYPLYVVFLIFFIQMTVFHISLYRNKFA
ncbi:MULTISPECIES: hypothetical protein [Bacillus]|uniref:DUF2178 domain-containing protein n=1 Tax=Bacillus pseudomycoides TaxID=64104 RepID=A0A1Y3MAJ2_9BACI|nr:MULTISPECIES: hypothetical protein [Bacillus cereus group]EOP61133.1 hypothetical protein IIW_04827 [Bacillus cereus VD136]EOP76246.1 hypothetical protein KOW_04568 [Bacillus cereus VDM006]EOQ15912.1 hypothetical protein KOY_03696 [Bacillus cereus VDM021]OOG92165.1 hypothetical protein BTH41_00661 [Bacillus mycoides]MDF2084071.1 DUF2178 domain-containing protein [Bacillus pseudomycoides]